MSASLTAMITHKVDSLLQDVCAAREAHLATRIADHSIQIGLIDVRLVTARVANLS